MHSKIFAITVVILFVVTILSFTAWFIWKPVNKYLQGEISAQTYKVSSQMPGRVDSLFVKKGQKVSKGELLYVLQSKTIEAKKKQVEALRSAAKAQNQKAIVGARKQLIDQATQLYNNSLIQEKVLRKTYDRVKALHDEGVVSSQKYDEVKAQYDAACNTVKMAKAQMDLALEGAQKEDKMAAAALVDQAEGGVNEVDSYLDDSHQYAPVNGEVSSVINSVGELVGAGMPVVTIVDLSDNWTVFNVKETLLPKMTLGKHIMTYIPALEKNVEMEITYIAPLASYATWMATSASGEFDVKSFEVHARPLPGADLTNLRLGMSVLVDSESL